MDSLVYELSDFLADYDIDVYDEHNIGGDKYRLDCVIVESGILSMRAKVRLQKALNALNDVWKEKDVQVRQLAPLTMNERADDEFDFSVNIEIVKGHERKAQEAAVTPDDEKSITECKMADNKCADKRLDTEDIWDNFDTLREELGDEELLMNLAKAMGTDMLQDLLDYIGRAYDVQLKDGLLVDPLEDYVSYEGRHPDNWKFGETVKYKEYTIDRVDVNGKTMYNVYTTMRSNKGQDVGSRLVGFGFQSLAEAKKNIDEGRVENVRSLQNKLTQAHPDVKYDFEIESIEEDDEIDSPDKTRYIYKVRGKNPVQFRKLPSGMWQVKVGGNTNSAPAVTASSLSAAMDDFFAKSDYPLPTENDELWKYMSAKLKSDLGEDDGEDDFDDGQVVYEDDDIVVESNYYGYATYDPNKSLDRIDKQYANLDALLSAHPELKDKIKE